MLTENLIDCILKMQQKNACNVKFEIKGIKYRRLNTSAVNDHISVGFMMSNYNNAFCMMLFYPNSVGGEAAQKCLFVSLLLFFFSSLPLSSHSSCLSACFHAYLPAFLPWCMYICLRAFLSVPQVLWDCHKVLITHMTSPTSCLPCILGLSGLKNPFTRLPLFSPSSHSCPPLSSLLSSRFPGLSPWCFTASLPYGL